MQGNKLYLFKPISLELVMKINLAQIKKVLVFSGQATLLSLIIENGAKLLLQSLRAPSLARFLKDMTKTLQMDSVAFEVNREIPLKPKHKRSQSGVAHSSFSLAPFKTELEVSMDGKPFESRVAVLQDLGLLLFRDLRDQTPHFLSLENASISSEAALASTGQKEGRSSLLDGSLQALIEIEPGHVRLLFGSWEERDAWLGAMQRSQTRAQAEEGRALSALTEV